MVVSEMLVLFNKKKKALKFFRFAKAFGNKILQEVLPFCVSDAVSHFETEVEYMLVEPIGLELFKRLFRMLQT